MTDKNSRSGDARMDAFAAELDEVRDHDVDCHPSEVAVVAIEDEEKLTMDLQEILQTGHDYSLVAFDGESGESITTLHFKPVESIYGDGEYSEGDT